MRFEDDPVEKQRLDFVVMGKGLNNVREWCRRNRKSPTTYYKWLKRHQLEGSQGLVDRSRAAHSHPNQSSAGLEAAVLAVRAQNPAWGGRKIRRVLRNQGLVRVPSASTVRAMLKRNGKLDCEKPHPVAYQRFERSRPNELWQMDYKGHFALANGRCHPLTVLDDHSRYALGLEACTDERAQTVKEKLTAIFRIFGMPEQMLADNGPPWGTAGAGHSFSELMAWLVQLGISLAHGRPYHPQTQGKDERFHRTLKAEVISNRVFPDHQAVQAAFNKWLPVYNYQRPHEALAMEVPASRYRPSTRVFPERLPPIEYGPGDAVRTVQREGYLSFRGHFFPISKGLAGYPVAVRPTSQEHRYEVFFCHLKVTQFDLLEQT